MQRAARKDSNHREIVEYCRGKGFAVLDIAQLKNACDIFISKDGFTVACEIKDGAKPPSARKLTEGEEKFRAGWKGAYRLITCVADIDNLMLSMGK
jgi:Holliday junction resolvase